MKTKLLLSTFFLSALMQAQTYTNSTITTIPDAVAGAGSCGSNVVPPTPSSSTINVPLSATITDPTNVTINLDLVHSWIGDVVAELETPGGTKCALIKRLGSSATDTSCGDSSTFTAGNVLSFNSTNATVISVVPATIPAGSYAPTGGLAATPSTIPLCNLNTFLNGVAINGDWKMNLRDYGAGDTGSLNSWSLVFTGLNNEEFLFTNSVSVLGNPFENELVVKVNNLSTTSALMNLYAMDGKLVNQTNVTNFAESTSINTATLTQGVYLLVAEIDGAPQKAIRVIKK